MNKTLIALATASLMLAIPVSADAEYKDAEDAYGVTKVYSDEEKHTLIRCDVNPDFVTGVGDYYVHDRPADGSPNGLISGDGTWLYREDNGVPGLQLSDGLSVLAENEIEAYADCPDGDAIIF